jgi:phosphoglycolate phosphatase
MHFSFDFDYTLADSSDGTVECANYALRKLGLSQRAPDKIKLTIGLSLERTFKALSGIDSVLTAAEFKRHFLQRADEVVLGYIQFYKGVEVILNQLKSDGHYLSIVSTKHRNRINQALCRDGLDHLIDHVVGGDCVSKNKPDPEGLYMAMRKSRIASELTVYIGDSVSDSECAYRAGVRFVGLLSGTTRASALERWQPFAVLDHVNSLSTLEL